MEQYISKSTVVAEIERRIKCITKEYQESQQPEFFLLGKINSLENILPFLETLEVKDWKKERMEECSFRKVGCTMYKDKILECSGACSWVVDYPKLKELKA